jgi:hypothetical protein
MPYKASESGGEDPAFVAPEWSLSDKYVEVKGCSIVSID